jgi:hypothetical protein
MSEAKGTFPVYYDSYVAQVESDSIIEALEISMSRRKELWELFSDDRWDYRYAEGKWTPKELLVHMMDTERIFNYRALRFARQDKTELHGYDHDAYVPVSEANRRGAKELMDEGDLVRATTISLFKSFSPEQLSQIGNANGVAVDVQGIGFIIAGHETHHVKVMRERYV